MSSPTSTPGEGAAAGAQPALGTFLEQAPDAAIVAEQDGTIFEWNAAATELLGYLRQEALGRNLADVFDGPRLRAATRRLERGAKPRPLDMPALHKDGREVWTEASLARISCFGRPCLMLTARDISRRVAGREEEFRERKQLEDTIASLEAFTYVVGHDLKEPVRAMNIYFDEILDDPANPEREDYIRRAAQANHALDRLLQGLLEWSRTAMEPLEPVTLRLQDVLNDPGCRAQFANLLTERGARLEVARDLPEVYATEALLCRVFGNLVTNAIRHNPAPDPFVRIVPMRAVAPGMVRIAVEDNGPGLPPAIKARLDRLPTKPATLKGGFGLVITRRAIERLNGGFSIELPPGGGTRFLVDLPEPPRETLEQRVRDLI